MTKSEPLKKALIASAGAGLLATMLTLLIDPTAAANGRLERLSLTGAVAMQPEHHTAIDTDGLANAPIFVMTSGPTAFKAQTLQVFGVSISPSRKAALVGIDGAAPVWLSVGDMSGQLRLTDVGTNGVSFDTPVGPRMVSLSDAPAAPPAKGG